MRRGKRRTPPQFPCDSRGGEALYSVSSYTQALPESRELRWQYWGWVCSPNKRRVTHLFRPNSIYLWCALPSSDTGDLWLPKFNRQVSLRDWAPLLRGIQTTHVNASFLYWESARVRFSILSGKQNRIVHGWSSDTCLHETSAINLAMEPMHAVETISTIENLLDPNPKPVPYSSSSLQEHNSVVVTRICIGQSQTTEPRLASHNLWRRVRQIGLPVPCSFPIARVPTI
jgi:hypothetical protein